MSNFSQDFQLKAASGSSEESWITLFLGDCKAKNFHGRSFHVTVIPFLSLESKFIFWYTQNEQWLRKLIS